MCVCYDKMERWWGRRGVTHRQTWEESERERKYRESGCARDRERIVRGREQDRNENGKRKRAL